MKREVLSRWRGRRQAEGHVILLIIYLLSISVCFVSRLMLHPEHLIDLMLSSQDGGRPWGLEPGVGQTVE